MDLASKTFDLCHEFEKGLFVGHYWNHDVCYQQLLKQHSTVIQNNGMGHFEFGVERAPALDPSSRP